MPNIIDYLDWRGDLPISEVAPFNEVDNLILSELVYADLKGIVTPPENAESIPLFAAAEAYFATRKNSDENPQTASLKHAPTLLKKLAKTPRFQNITLSSYIDEIDKETEMQFAAMTVELPDNTLYVAYRGTDNTLVGWKEDFNMGFLSHTPGQIRAAAYLETVHKKEQETGKTYRVGGHSKGGNFAVFASAFCSEEAQEKITEIWSNDGPGFRPEITGTDEYQRILPKIKSFVPEMSIVSLILENDFKPRVIKSDGAGATQHDPMSWQVKGDRFIYAAELSEESRMLDRTLSNWLSELSDVERELFVDTLFDIIQAGGASTVDDLASSKRKAVLEALRSMDKLDEDAVRIFGQSLRKLAQSGGAAMRTNFFEKMKK